MSAYIFNSLSASMLRSALASNFLNVANCFGLPLCLRYNHRVHHLSQQVKERVTQRIGFHFAVCVTNCFGFHLLLVCHAPTRSVSRPLRHPMCCTVFEPQPLLTYQIGHEVEPRLLHSPVNCLVSRPTLPLVACQPSFRPVPRDTLGDRIEEEVDIFGTHWQR